MGIALFKIKIMPESPDSDLDVIEKAAVEIITSEQGNKTKFDREPIAFGLNALNVMFARDENLDSDVLIEKLGKIEHVSSAEITDFRRAFG